MSAEIRENICRRGEKNDTAEFLEEKDEMIINVLRPHHTTVWVRPLTGQDSPAFFPDDNA